MHAMNCHHGHKYHSLNRCYGDEQGFLSKGQGNKIFVEREIQHAILVEIMKWLGDYQTL